MKVLVCGGRDYTGWITLQEVLDEFLGKELDKDKDTIFTVIHGNAIGADFLAKVWVEDHWRHQDFVRQEVYPANWKKHGKSAGAIRNQQMLDEGKPDMVVAFPGGRGTEHMKSIARKVGVPVHEVEI